MRPNTALQLTASAHECRRFYNALACAGQQLSAKPLGGVSLVPPTHPSDHSGTSRQRAIPQQLRHTLHQREHTHLGTREK